MKQIRSRCAQFLIVIVTVTGCASAPPDKLDNICDIFREKGGWYDDMFIS